MMDDRADFGMSSEVGSLSLQVGGNSWQSKGNNEHMRPRPAGLKLSLQG